MKTPITLVFILFCPLFLLAQETVEVKLTPKNSYYSEVFHVLKSDKSIKHGPYKKVAKHKNALIEEGFYKMGKKDSVWIQYGWLVETISTKGQYTNDVPTGEWEYYIGKDLDQRYNYTTNTMIYSKKREQTKDTTLVVFNGTDSAKMKVDAAPEMIGGMNLWQQFLNKNLRYPMDAIDNDIQGTVLIGFKVQPDGTLSDFWIKKSAHKSLDAEALRVLKLSNLKWIPASVNGKPVAVSYHLPIIYRLEEN